VDCYDGSDGPRVYHSYTLTTQLKFEDIVITVKENAFKISE
jgi:hypothetical protein